MRIFEHFSRQHLWRLRLWLCFSCAAMTDISASRVAGPADSNGNPINGNVEFAGSGEQSPRVRPRLRHLHPNVTASRLVKSRGEGSFRKFESDFSAKLRIARQVCRRISAIRLVFFSPMRSALRCA